MTDHLPPNSRVIVLSATGRLVSMPELVPTLPTDRPTVFVAGAMAHGKVEVDYGDECVALSGYPLSGAMALARLTCAYENHLGIV